MAFAPYDAKELARLRHFADQSDLGSMAHRLLATVAQVEAERDELRADLTALRDAARALVEAPGLGEVQGCDKCAAFATRLMEWNEDGVFDAFLCDHHAEKQLASDDPPPLHDRELHIAAPLRALRALVEEKP